jgi:hypothetical protein
MQHSRKCLSSRFQAARFAAMTPTVIALVALAAEAVVTRTDERVCQLFSQRQANAWSRDEFTGGRGQTMSSPRFK